MKKYFYNDEGYSLLIVLLIISIFTILILSFIRISASTTKQNIIVEDNFKSAALAEMGVEFYTTAIENELEKLSSVAENAYNTYIANVSKIREVTQTDIKNAIDEGIKAAFNSLKSKLESDLIQYQNKIDIGSNYGQFSITPDPSLITFDIVNKIAEIKFVSTGIQNNVEESIESTITINFGTMYRTSSNEELISDPDPNNKYSVCIPSSSKNNHEGYSNISCKFDGERTFTKQTSISYSTIKITGSAKFPNKIGISNSTLYVSGDFSDGNGNDAIIKSNIFVGKNAVFGNLNNSKDVIIVVMGNATIGNIQGSASNVKICVHGTVTGGSSNNSGVKIYDKNNNPEAFEENGACIGNSSGDLIWDVPFFDKNYSYNYVKQN
ncbi:hypothetical protein [Lysinibacillus endophyticus]|uniref:hypothetical protein n=1 Tax=Ureibacillus endophyticus TaxID=1978490 RepID=UPI00313646E9